jgi:phage recombination protein Bet
MSHLVTVNQDIAAKKDLIKRMFCKNCTDDELELFMHACKRSGLDPFMKQIYAIKRGTAMTIQTGIDGFRLLADRSGNYAPGRESTFTYDDKGKLTSATAYLKKRTTADNIWHEVSATAYMDEYSSGQNLWTKMPRTMLAKCAESLALRKAFPAELSGLHTKEEMNQDEPHDVDESTGELKSAEVKMISATPVDKEQLAVLEAYVKEYPDSLPWMLDKFGVKQISDVPAIHFEMLVSIFKRRKEKDNEEKS